MSRDQRKTSRSLEERNIIASTTRVSQISQTDNELRQKLEAIDTSHKLSNKRIRKETRELKEILRGLQKELKVSKGVPGQYIPSLFEQPQGRVRRTTVSSVPSEDRKEAVNKRDLNHDLIARRRSGSFPADSHEHFEILKDSSEPIQDNIFQEPGRELRNVVVEKTKPEQLKIEQIGLRQNEQEYKRASHLSQSRRQRRLVNCSPTEQQQQGGRKKSSTEGSRSFSKVLRGKFVTNDDTTLLSSTRSLQSSYKTSQTLKLSEESREAAAGSNWQRPNIVEEYSLAPNNREYRKFSLGVSQYHEQRKGRGVGNKGDIPMPGFHGRFEIQDSDWALDSLPENIGGRRLSIAHGRVRRTSRATGLPPLKEEKTAPRLEETPAENWSDLAKCRYLRKEEKEISIDDIFGKK